MHFTNQTGAMFDLDIVHCLPLMSYKIVYTQCLCYQSQPVG